MDATELIRNAKNPVILAGGGVVMGEGVAEVQALAEHLQAPVCTTYLHNDAFPASHPLWCGPLGYLGHQTAMNTIMEADLVLAIGTRCVHNNNKRLIKIYRVPWPNFWWKIFTENLNVVCISKFCMANNLTKKYEELAT